MGKHKYIETPERMYELFEAYKKETKDNPRIKVDYVGKDGNKVNIPLEVPLTMSGFENYVARQGLNQELSHYFSNKDNAYSEYLAICSRVKSEIRQDQIEGGMVGQYNASITQRLNNLVEKTHNVNIEQPLFGPDPE
jgi:hypothetical protein